MLTAEIVRASFRCILGHLYLVDEQVIVLVMEGSIHSGATAMHSVGVRRSTRRLHERSAVTMLGILRGREANAFSERCAQEQMQERFTIVHAEPVVSKLGQRRGLAIDLARLVSEACHDDVLE